MGLANNFILLIELSHAEQVVKIPIQRKPTDFNIYKIFLDPSGRHLIVTSTQGENWYLFRGWKKPKQLKTFKMVIESVAWNKPALLSSTHATSTREMLIGARNGSIYEAVLDAEEDFFKSPDRYCQLLFSLPEKPPITGIKFDFFPPSDVKKVLVIVTTASRIYQFVGSPDRRLEEGGRDSGRVFMGLFASYKDTAPSEYFLVLSGYQLLILRRDTGVTGKYPALRPSVLYTKLGPGTLVTHRDGLDDGFVLFLLLFLLY